MQLRFGRRKAAPVALANPARNHLEQSRSEGGSLTAAGQRVGRREANSILRLRQPWQTRAFSYYDLLGEIKFASLFYSRMLAPLRLYVAWLNDKGEWEETTDANVVQYLERIQDPGGGRSGLLSAYGRLRFIAGECYLFVSQGDDGEEKWEMLSTSELRPTDQGYARLSAPSLPTEEYRQPADDDYAPVDDKTAVAYRLWQRHPEYSSLADSTMRGVLDVAEELVLLTQGVRARVRSRLAGAGILLVSEDIEVVKPPSVEPGEDLLTAPFFDDLTEAMTAPIIDEGTAAAVVPLIVRVPADQVEKAMKHISIVDPTQLYPETGLRREAIERLAVGLDMPPEVLTGLGNVNHWGSWAIDEQTWKGHGQPLAQGLVDDLTAAYFRPTLKNAGVDDWKRYRIDYDAADVINHPDKTRDAKDLHAVAALSDEALRYASGFDESDKPSEEELARRIGILVRDGSLAMTGEPRALDSPPAPDGTALQPPPVGSTEVVKGPPPVPGEKPAVAPLEAAGNGYDAQVARVLGAADLALLRAREAAGNRLRGYAKRDSESAALIEGVPARQVAFTLGQERVRQLKCPSELELVTGAHSLIVDAFQVWRIDPEVASRIAAQVEAHAARTLYEERPSPLPGTFENYARGILTGSRQ